MFKVSNIIRVFHWPPKATATLQTLMTLSDVQSLYQWNGISDAVITFYNRVFLQTSDTVALLGPLTYESLKRYPAGDKETLSQANRNINGANFDLKKPVILFPCKPRNTWHWILVAIATTLKRVYVLDSLSDCISPSSSEVIANIQHFLVTLGVISDGDSFIPFPLKVCRQKNNTDCGIHVLHNTTMLSELSIEDIERTTRFKEDFSTMAIRRRILEKAHELSGKYARHRISASTKMEATKREKSIVELRKDSRSLRSKEKGAQ